LLGNQCIRFIWNILNKQNSLGLTFGRFVGGFGRIKASAAADDVARFKEVQRNVVTMHRLSVANRMTCSDVNTTAPGSRRPTVRHHITFEHYNVT